MTDPSSESRASKAIATIVQPEELPRPGRLLGLDFGTKRVGVALSTPEQTIASPLETYSRKSAGQDAEALARLVKEHRIVGIVVGLPMHTGGEEGIKAREARDFGQWVSAVAGRPVTFWDERFTTSVAQDLMREAGVPKSKWKERVDKLAAQILLQSFLDSRLAAPG
jgi:putative holliday junction resolvase